MCGSSGKKGYDSSNMFKSTVSKSAVINALSFDIEDWFQVENLRSVVKEKDWERYELRVVKNTHKILKILRDQGIKATFFILGWVAERCPDLVRYIASEGHEIASHGYSHRLINKMSKEEFKRDLILSKTILEKLTHKKVLGYRAPSFTILEDTIWAIEILKEAGFKYDSSIFPVSFHDRYGFNGISGIPFYFPNGLLEIPLTTLKIFKFQIPLGGGGYFRLFPYYYFHYFFKYINYRKKSVVFYLHPWELDPEQPRLNPPFFLKIRHYINLEKTEKKLKLLLKNFRFGPINQVISELSNS